MPTFGDTNIESNLYGWGTHKLLGGKFELAENGILRRIIAYVSADATYPLKAAIYDNANNLLAVTLDSYPSNTMSWVPFEFAAGLNLAPGFYWLVIASTESSITYTKKDTGEHIAGYFGTEFPAVLTGDLINWTMSIYGEYDSGGPGPLTITVSPPSASLLINQQQLFTAEVSGGTAPYTITWLDSYGTVLGSGTTYVFSSATLGTYNILAHVIDSVSLIADSAVIPITVTSAPILSVIVSPLIALVQVGSSVLFNATVSGGTPPSTIQWIDSISQTVLGTGLQYTFTTSTAGTFEIYARVTDSSTPVQTANSVVVPITVTTTPPSPTTFTENVSLIYDQPWLAMNQNCLDNYSKVVSDLSAGHIKYAVIFIGYYNATNPAAPTVAWVRTPSYYANVINALHAVEIKAIAWIENGNQGKMDIGVSNRPNILSVIKMVMDMGWDGYMDDIEDWAGKPSDTVTANQQQSDWLNYLTPWLHNGANFANGEPRLNMPAVGYDWTQSMNQNLYVDFILSMFYSNISILEDPQAQYYWQEDFGENPGSGNTPTGGPASPLIMIIMNYYGNQNSLAWQLGQVNKYLSLYGHPNLYGFGTWVYEYMGTNADDWQQWNAWLSGAAAHTITVKTAPIVGVQGIFNGAKRYTPYDLTTFIGTVTASVPAQVQEAQNSILIGDSDHSGGQEGYDVYAYAAGPYRLANTVNGISSVYLYTRVAGNVKVAIYSAKQYAITGWDPPGFTQWHPDQLLTQSPATACVVEGWNLITFPATNLPTTFFIAITGDQSGIIGLSSVYPPPMVDGATWGYDQFITKNYADPWPQSFPTVEGAMGNNVSVYIPTMPIVYTLYYFSEWEDGSINPTRTVTASADVTVTAYYVTVAPPTTVTLNVVAGANGNVSPSGSQVLNIGQLYQFTVAPNIGYQLDHWDLGGANIGSTNPITITATIDMNNKILTALFTTIPPVQINLNIAITGKGVTNPTSGTQIFNVGDSVQFTAIPNAGYSFTDWKLDGSIYTDNPLTFTIIEDMNGKTLTAEFTGPTPITSAILPAGIAILGVAGLVYYLATRKKR